MRRAGLIVLLMLLFAQRAEAQVDLGQGGWLSGQNALLMKLLATELDSLGELTSILANVRTVVQAGNEALALARTTYREYKAITNYNRDDLIRDAKRGLYEAFPDLALIEQNAGLLEDQYERSGEFLEYWNLYDRKIQQTVGKVMSHTYKSTIWPWVFPEAMVKRENPSPVDIKIWNLYKKSGMVAEVAVQKTALAALAQKVAGFVRDAEESGNLEVAATAASAQLQLQEVSNSTEFLNLYKAELGAREEARDTLRRRSRALKRTMRENLRELMAPGGGMYESQRR